MELALSSPSHRFWGAHLGCWACEANPCSHLSRIPILSFSLTVESRALQSEQVLNSELHLCTLSSEHRLASGGGLESFTKCTSCDTNLEKSVVEGEEGRAAWGVTATAGSALRSGSWQGCCPEWTQTLWAPWGIIPALHPCSPPSLLSQHPHVSFLQGPEHHQSWGTVVHASG